MVAGSGALPRGVADPASMAAPSAAITLRRTTLKKRPKVMLCLTTGTFYNGPLYKAWAEDDTKVPEVRLPPQRQPAKLIEECGEHAAQFWKFRDPSPCDIGRTTAHAAESGCTLDQSTGPPSMPHTVQRRRLRKLHTPVRQADYRPLPVRPAPVVSLRLLEAAFDLAGLHLL